MTARRIALAALAIACACKPHPGAMKRADDAPASSTAVDPLGDAESRIADNAAKMRALGIELPQTREQKPDAAPEAELPKAEPTKPAPETELEKARRKEPVVAPAPVTPAPPTDEPSAATKQSGETDRCTQICELADVACGLEQQVCRLADLHVGEPRYEDACWRARDQCERGRDACDECSAAC